MFDIDDEWVPVAPVPSEVDVVGFPDAAAASLALEPPGPDSVVALSMLDPAALTHSARIDVLVALERQIAWLSGVQQRVLTSIAADPGAAADEVDRTGRQWVREDVSCALRLSGLTAQRRLAVAQTLTSHLPATQRLLERGEISYLHAMSLAEAVLGLDGQSTAAVEERVLRRAREQTLSEFKGSVRRAVASVDAAAVEQRRVEAMGERRVCVTPRDDGMAELWALLPAEGAAVLMSAVNALASVTSAEDERGIDQRRADALVDLGVAAIHDPLLPRQHGTRPSIQVTVALSTLLGVDDQPAELDGHGPIPAAVARRLAADPTGTWRRLVTDPVDGTLLDYGRSTYRPPADLAAFVIARDQVCAFPGCRRPARHCELDHRRAWAAGGTTDPHNIGALCKRHHLCKHQGGWHLDRDNDGSYQWTSPTRHRYRARPPELPVGARTFELVENDPDPPPF